MTELEEVQAKYIKLLEDKRLLVDEIDSKQHRINSLTKEVRRLTVEADWLSHAILTPDGAELLSRISKTIEANKDTVLTWESSVGVQFEQSSVQGSMQILRCVVSVNRDNYTLWSESAQELVIG